MKAKFRTGTMDRGEGFFPKNIMGVMRFFSRKIGRSRFFESGQNLLFNAKSENSRFNFSKKFEGQKVIYAAMLGQSSVVIGVHKKWSWKKIKRVIRDRSKSTRYLGQALGKICLKNILRPAPFFS